MDMNLLYKTYKEKNYNKFLKLFNEYLEMGYGVDIPLINTYIIALTKLRKYEQAARVLKTYEKELIKDRAINTVLNSYIRCFKLEEAERVLYENGYNSVDPLNLVELYLLEGKIDEAKLETKIIRKNNTLDEKQKERLDKCEKIIYNHENKNGLIETEYQCFLKNGNKLEVGHIVFLKKKPEVDDRISHDVRALNRTYMIWKIDGEKLYLFPVSGICKGGYILYHQKYPNSIGDRIIKNNTCISYKKDVLSVKDKVLDEDMKYVLRCLYDSLYFGQEEYQNINEEFIKYYMKKPEKYNIIEIVEKETKKHKFYLVLDVVEEEIKTVEIDITKRKIIGTRQETISKNKMFYNVLELDKKILEDLKKELKKITKVNPIGKKITVNGEKLIIIDESDDKYFCINRIYSSSFIIPVVIEKSKVENLEESIRTEELEFIKLILSQSNINIKSKLKDKSKKLIY